MVASAAAAAFAPREPRGGVTPSATRKGRWSSCLLPLLVPLTLDRPNLAQLQYLPEGHGHPAVGIRHLPQAGSSVLTVEVLHVFSKIHMG